MIERSVVVTNADCEPGRTIAGVLAEAGDRVSTSVAEGVTRFGCVDALVSCYRLDRLMVGGVSVGVEGLDLDEFLNGVAHNLTDPFFAAQAAATQMLAQDCPHASARRKGCIVHITSVAGVLALPGQATFCASMAALAAATQVLATEWSPRGIRVAAIGAGLSAELLAGLRELPGAVRRVPDSAVVHPQLIAETVQFVLSDAGAGIAGVPLFVDGGWLSDGYWETLFGKKS